MVREIFVYLLVTANIINMAHLGFYVIGANIYDIRKFREGTPKGEKAKVSRKRKPLISIIVPAHNEEVVITRTLDSINASTYKKLEIIVVDDGSTDNTTKVVRTYIRNSPALKIGTYMARRRRSSELERHYIRAEVNKRRIVLISQRNGGKASAMNNAIINHARGSLIMCLDADSMLDPHAIERAVHYFDDPKIIGVAANVRVMESKSLIGKLQRFEHMIGYRSKKFYTLTNSEFIVGGVASTYRAKVLKQVGFYDTDTITEDIGLSMKLVAEMGNRDSRIVYAADVLAMTEGVQTFKALMRQRYRWKMGSLQNLLKYSYLVANDDAHKYSYMLTFYRLPMAFISELLLVLEPFLLGYVVYLSIAFHTLWILVGAYITITLYVLWTLWPDEHLTVRQKIRMSFQAFEIYILFYAMDVVQISAIFRCLFQYKKIVNRTTGQTWVSPARAGQAALPSKA
jgi:biofilm PGA synthesis N-glycosyltransferase PgaC